MLDKQHLFIIGSPKSGTTWLKIMLGAHPLVCTTVELTLFSRYTAPWLEAWNHEADNIKQGRWNQGLPFLWTEEEFYDFLREFITRVYSRVVELKPQATHVLDKHPGYSSYIEDIDKLLPKARFIHIIRDGRDVALSMVAARKNLGYGTKTIPKSAEAWKYHLRAARKASQYKDRYLEIRYEDLLTAGVETLKTVFDFCELPISQNEVVEIVNTHRFEQMKANRQAADKRLKTKSAFYRKGKAGSWKEEMSPVQRYIFDQLAGDLLYELGYATDDWWAQGRIQTLTLPLLAMITAEKWVRAKLIRNFLKVLLGPTLSGHIKVILRSRIRKVRLFNSNLS